MVRICDKKYCAANQNHNMNNTFHITDNMRILMIKTKWQEKYLKFSNMHNTTATT